MPFKSKAQRRKFAELLVKGEISPETYEEWNRETGGARLPERVRPKKRSSPRTDRRKKTAAQARPKPKAAARTRPKPKARARPRSRVAKQRPAP